jgi:RNA-directed DNA polymerase
MPTSIWSLFARESTESSSEETQMTIEQSIGAASAQAPDWDSLDWNSIRQQVRRLQMRIAKAISQKRHSQARSLQWLLTHSRAAKLLAVQRVTQNKGHNTPGIDNKVWRTDRQKFYAVTQLKRRGYKPQPLRRIYIKKKNGKLRPLSIPTMLDRAQQALHMLALQPVAETCADRNSYGFREGRCCADAIGQCFIVLSRNYAPQWILEGDIKSCFDQISHQWLLDHIVMDRRTLQQWLKAGFMENQRLFPTTTGTPQGGIASPVLANLTLDGMEQTIRSSINPLRDKVNFIRYADDFVVTAATREILEQKVKPAVVEFLRERGLKLSEEKTVITRIDQGFDFLGQRLRKFGKKLLIKPTRQSVRSVLEKARQRIRSSYGTSAAILIRKLNPILQGWANYHRHVVSKRIYSRTDQYIRAMLVRWARREHRNKTPGWIQRRYFSADDKGSFSVRVPDREGKQRVLKVHRLAHTVIERHIKVRGEANPYDANHTRYFEKRKCFVWRTYPVGPNRTTVVDEANTDSKRPRKS